MWTNPLLCLFHIALLVWCIMTLVDSKWATADEFFAIGNLSITGRNAIVIIISVNAVVTFLWEQLIICCFKNYNKTHGGKKVASIEK